MKIVLCLALSIAIAATGGALINALEPTLSRAPDFVTIPALGGIFFGTIALVWVPWYFIARR